MDEGNIGAYRQPWNTEISNFVKELSTDGTIAYVVDKKERFLLIPMKSTLWNGNVTNGS